MPSPKAIIIGSGVAGMATAIRLAVQGFEVHVYEKNSYPGGKLSSITVGGYHFDAGPSLFTQPQNIAELFALAGENMQEYLPYETLPIACRYFYEDGKVLNGYTDAEKFANEVHNVTGEDPEAVLNYLRQSQRLYNNIGGIFLNNSLHKAKTWLKPSIAKALATVKPEYLFKTLHNVNARRFKQPHTVQLFNRFATYNGSNPYEAPGMLSLIPHLEHNEGAFYPKGGMISITNALYKLAEKKGVHFYFDEAVQRIIENEGHAIGVVANGVNIYGDVIVSNMDVLFTYRNLLQDDKAAAKLAEQPRSSSAMVFYWGIKKEFAGLYLHNIFFSNDYKTEFDYIFNRGGLYHDPTVYINITSKMEPGLHAPQGTENWFVLVNVPAFKGQNMDAMVKQCRKNVIAKLNRMLQTNIEEYIEAEDMLTPLQIESRTASYAGALYGTSSNTKMAAFMRHPNFSRKIGRLYFAGGSAHPGGGIPLCLKSAKITAGLIGKDKMKWGN
jgi:phytoene desaturase